MARNRRASAIDVRFPEPQNNGIDTAPGLRRQSDSDMLDQSGLLVLIAAQPLQHFQRQTLLAERGIDLVQRAIDHVLVLVLDVNIEADQPHPHPGIERAAILRAFLHPFDQARQAADARSPASPCTAC